MIPTAFRIHRFHPSGLDPVAVFVEEYQPGASRIVVQCYAQAWTAYWGNHGKQKSAENFVLSCEVDYIVDNLIWGLNGRMTKASEKNERQYLIRIVKAMKEHFAVIEAGKGGAE